MPIVSLTVYPRFVVNYDFSHFTIFGYLTKKIYKVPDNPTCKKKISRYYVQSSQSLWVVALYKILKAVSLLLLYVFCKERNPRLFLQTYFFLQKYCLSAQKTPTHLKYRTDIKAAWAISTVNKQTKRT